MTTPSAAVAGPSNPPLSRIKALVSRLRIRFAPTRLKHPVNDTEEAEIAAGRVVQQRTTRGRVYDSVWIIRLILIVGGLGWLLCLPLEQLGRRTFVDEHAIQPAQVTTTWSWGDVHAADVYLGNFERLWERNATSEEKSDYISTELRKLGIPAGIQSYAFDSPSIHRSGINTYAHISPPRSSGAEALLLTAPFTSLTGGPNLRGLSILLALARFLRGQNHWAKDIVLLWADGSVEGVEAFLKGYHGEGGKGWTTGQLELAPQGAILQALNIDYPGHSYSHLGIFYEGINGRLPNQDLVNSVMHIARWSGQSPVRLYNLEADLQGTACPSWLPSAACDLLQHEEVQKYARAARHLGQHFRHAALGTTTGAHGSFAKYRIDGLTLFAVPATGPHGFHALGITIESSLRSLNNILERLHASFFFYAMQSPDRFLQIGSYLPAAIMLSASITIGGLKLWIDAGWHLVKDTSDSRGLARIWARRDRHVGNGVLAVTGCAAAGSVALSAIAKLKIPGTAAVWIMSGGLIAAILGSTMRNRAKVLQQQPSSCRLTIAGVSHIAAGAITACLAMINFPQATGLALLFLPNFALAEVAVRSNAATRRYRWAARALSLVLAVGMGRAQLSDPRGADVWLEWQLLGSWLVPLFLNAYWPLQLVICMCM